MKKTYRLLATALCLFTLVSCRLVAAIAAPEVPQPDPEVKVPFVYYLQKLDLPLLMKINPQMAVIDPHDSKLTMMDIGYLRKGGMTLIAYLSAGEADPARKDKDDGYAYQPEWDNAPWIKNVPKEVSENKMWESRRVEYWNEEWQQILLTRLRHAINQGYDGIMLDTVDSFYMMKPHYKDRDVRQDMADMIGRLRDEAKTINPNFKILINSGMELYDTTYTKTGEPFLSVIDGQLKEDTWYNEKGPITAEWTESDLAYLKRAVDAGKPVYSIDYFTNDEVKEPNMDNMRDYFAKARAFGVIPYAADRSLGVFLEQNRQPSIVRPN